MNNMELEYKWALPEGWSPEGRISGAQVSGREELSMEAVYFDTPDGYVAGLRGALRLRRENGRAVCCLKIALPDASGASLRREYQVPAGTIEEGIALLPSAGAPEDICRDIASRGVVPACSTSFRRLALELQGGGWTGELALDRGSMSKGTRSAPIGEIELEYKSGDTAAFHAFAAALQSREGLRVRAKSKSQRTMEL